MKPKKILCLILSLLMIAPSLCFASCDSANVGDVGGDIIGGLSTDETQGPDTNKVPLYTAPAKYKEIAKSDTVYRSGIYTGYSIIVRTSLEDKDGMIIGRNLGEVILKYPGETFPVHEDPTCSHDSGVCPTMSDGMSKTALIVDTGSGLPVIFYFGFYWGAVYSEEKGDNRPSKIGEVRGYDVETGEYTTVAEFPDIGVIDNAILYKGKMYITGGDGDKFCMVDIVTGESKILEGEDYYNEYNILDIVNDRLYYMHVFGEEGTEEHKIVKNNFTLKSCSLDLDDVRTEYDFGDLGNDYGRYGNVMHYYSYMDGNMIYFPKESRYAFDVQALYPDSFYFNSDFEVYSIYAFDLNDMSAGEKLILRDVHIFEAKKGKLYYTLPDYKETGEVRYYGEVSKFGANDGGTLYEYDIATGTTREVCSDSGYSIIEIYEITDDGKLFFDGRDYVNFVPADEGNYSNNYYAGRKEYCMLDLATGEVTELYWQLKLKDMPEENVPPMPE